MQGLPDPEHKSRVFPPSLRFLGSGRIFKKNPLRKSPLPGHKAGASPFRLPEVGLPKTNQAQKGGVLVQSGVGRADPAIGVMSETLLHTQRQIRSEEPEKTGPALRT